MSRSIFNFCFWTKNWSIDHALSDKSTKREGPKCRSAQEEWGWGGGRGRRETELQLSAIFNVGYVLGTSLRKEAGNTTLECCFSLNMDAVNVDFVRHLVVTQGKTHSQVSLSVLRLLPLNGHFLNRQLGDVSQRCPSQRQLKYIILSSWSVLLKVGNFLVLMLQRRFNKERTQPRPPSP